LASIDGWIGMSVPSVRSPNWRANRSDTTTALMHIRPNSPTSRVGVHRLLRPQVGNRSSQDNPGRRSAGQRGLGQPALLPQGHDDPRRGGRQGLTAIADRRATWVTRDGQHTPSNRQGGQGLHCWSSAPGPSGNMRYQRQPQDPAEGQHQGDHHHPHDLHRYITFAPVLIARDSHRTPWQAAGRRCSNQAWLRPAADGQDSTSWARIRAKARRCSREMCIWE
jgi:hypothetical protein